LRSLKTNKTKLMNVAGGFCSLDSFVHIRKFHFQVFTFSNEKSFFYSKMFSLAHTSPNLYSSIKTAILSLLCYTILSIHKKNILLFHLFDFFVMCGFLIKHQICFDLFIFFSFNNINTIMNDGCININRGIFIY